MKIYCTMLGVALLLLVGCQTASVPVSVNQPPRAVTEKTVADMQNALIRDLKTMGYKVVGKTADSLVLEQVLTPNSTERKQHASYSEGTPRSQITFRFTDLQGITKVTAQMDMLINPGKPNQERVSLLDSPDGGRLQRILDSLA